MILRTIIVLVAIAVRCDSEEAKPQKTWALVGNPLAHARPCEGNEDILVSFESGRPPGEENQYSLFVSDELPATSRAMLKFDSEATVNLSRPDQARVSTIGDTFFVHFFKKGHLGLQVRGPASGTIPYLTSLIINTVEYCEKPLSGYLDSLILGYQPVASVELSVPDQSCGRRKVKHTELIVNGQPTKPGDWPWHTALYRLDGSTLNYICGGTLISKTLVLTAAHCVTIRGDVVLTESLNVVLGKYNLVGGDKTIQEREVHSIVIHEEYDYRLLHNDIGFLKLKSEVTFNDYVQPVCLWNTNVQKKLPAGEVFGTVVGWGFDQTDKLATKLQQTKMPIVTGIACLRSNPLFYSRILNTKKFCAGYTNGTSACNGDSGGGFVVFVPDTSGDSSDLVSGAYHLRGIVSTTVSRRDEPICDPRAYGVYTDVDKFRQWLTKVMVN